MKFINKELAIKLKKKGFDRPCFGWYYIETPTGMKEGELVLNRYSCRGGTYKETLERHIDFQPKEGFVGYINKNIVDAPTIDQTLEWLREEKNIVIHLLHYCNLEHKNSIIYYWNVSLFNININNLIENNKDIYITFIDHNYKNVRYQSTVSFMNYDDAILAGINFVVEHFI